MKGADALTKKLTHELNAQRLNGFGAPTEKLPRRGAVDKWTVRAGARTRLLAVDNAARCPPRSLLPTDPQPSTTKFRNSKIPPYGRSIGRYKASCGLTAHGKEGDSMLLYTRRRLDETKPAIHRHCVET